MTHTKGIQYFGGKTAHLDRILPLLPHTETYIEACTGGGSVFMGKQPMSKHNILNDLDDRIVNMFRMLRTRGDELVSQLELTPHARQEYMACDFDTDDPLELARQTITTLWLSRHHLPRDKKSNSDYTTTYADNGSPKYTARKIKALKPIIAKLQNAYIEHMDVCKLLDKCNGKGMGMDALIYIDPPYVHASRGASAMYGHEMTDEQHALMLNRCRMSPHKVAISGYRNQLYDTLLDKWRCVEWSTTVFTPGMVATGKAECLWMNYDTPQGVLALDSGQ